MIPGAFEYHAPRTLGEALALLREYGEDAKLLAGGQSLIPAMRFRLAVPERLIDLGGLRDLDYLEPRGDHLAIGALTRECTLEAAPEVAAHYPLLLDAARVIADPLVRNRATIGGNLAHADPANDHPAVMLAYDATVIAHGAAGERAIPIDSFFTELFECALAPDEILTEIRLPWPHVGDGGAYEKVERKVGDYAIAAAAVQLRWSGARCEAARIGLTNVSPVPLRATDAEALLIGSILDEAALEAAGQAAAAQCDPTADLRGSVEYKRDLVRVVTKRAARRALARARGEVA